MFSLNCCSHILEGTYLKYTPGRRNQYLKRKAFGFWSVVPDLSLWWCSELWRAKSESGTLNLWIWKFFLPWVRGTGPAFESSGCNLLGKLFQNCAWPYVRFKLLGKSEYARANQSIKHIALNYWNIL